MILPVDPLDAIRETLSEAVAALEKPDGRRFLELALPLPDLRRLREQQTLTTVAQALEGDLPRREKLLAQWRAFAAAEPVLHPSGDLATVTVATARTTELPTVLQTLTDPKTQPAPPSTGFADDLPTALRLAADALEGGALATFVEKMFPPSDLSDYASGSRGLETVQLLERHPEMVRQMAADLRQLADAEFQWSADRTLATLPRDGRPVKFQKVAGSWRFFDDSRPVREAVFDQSRQFPPGGQAAVRLERVGDQWRVYELPPDVLERLLPQGEESP